MKANPRWRIAGFLVILSGLACSDDEARIISPPPDDTNTAPDPAGNGAEGVYAVASEIETPEGDVLYLDTVSDLRAPFNPVDTGIEIPNASTFKYIDGQVFVGTGDAPTITRYVLDADGRLQADRTLNFSGVGVTQTRDYTIISPTKAYLYDRETYVAHVWNPSTMELSGTEIDFSGAFHEEYGSVLIFSAQRILRDGTLFVPGGWVTETVYPRSLVLAFDTLTDSVQVLEDDRCTLLISTVMSSAGDLFFFPESNALVTSELPSCGLVVRQGATSFDTSYVFDAGTALGGRMVFDAYPGPNGSAYLMVPDESRIEANTREEVRLNARNDMRFWKLDLATESAVEVTSVPHFSRVRFSFDIGDGQRLVNVERLDGVLEDGVAANDADVSLIKTTLYELLLDDSPTEFPLGIGSDEVRARIAEIAKLR